MKTSHLKNPHFEEYRSSRILQSIKAGPPLNAFNRAAAIRGVQFGPWWERALAALALAFVVATLTNVAIRHLTP